MRIRGRRRFRSWILFFVACVSDKCRKPINYTTLTWICLYRLLGRILSSNIWFQD